MANFGIFISTMPSQEERISLQEDIAREITQGSLRNEDAMMIRKLSRSAGIDAAYQYMAVKRKKYAKEKLEMEAALKQQEQQRQLMMQQAAAQAKQMEQQGQAQLIQLENQAELEKELAILKEKHRLEMEKSQAQFQYDAILKGVEDDGQMAKERYKEDRKDERVELQGKINAKKEQEVSKVKQGQKPEVDTEEIQTESLNIQNLM